MSKPIWDQQSPPLTWVAKTLGHAWMILTYEHNSDTHYLCSTYVQNFKISKFCKTWLNSHTSKSYDSPWVDCAIMNLNLYSCWANMHMLNCDVLCFYLWLPLCFLSPKNILILSLESLSLSKTYISFLFLQNLFLPLFDTYVKGLYTYSVFVQEIFMDLNYYLWSYILVITCYLQWFDLDSWLGSKVN